LLTLQDQYIYNLRGLNDKEDFPPQFLMDIFKNIKNDEIKIHREHVEQCLSDITWQNLYNDSRHGCDYYYKFNELNSNNNNGNDSKEPLGDLLNNSLTDFIVTSSTVKSYDAMFFSSIWRKILAATKFVYSTTKEPEILVKTLEILHMCADITAHYKMYHAFDTLIITMCELSTITSTNTNPTITTTITTTTTTTTITTTTKTQIPQQYISVTLS
jgi:golgi-specific brefeldin A-resistance guanine nucleotide exchange factor 1